MQRKRRPSMAAEFQVKGMTRHAGADISRLDAKHHQTDWFIALVLRSRLKSVAMAQARTGARRWNFSSQR